MGGGGGGMGVLGSTGSPITFNYCSAQSLNKNNLVSVKLNCSVTQVVCFRDQILRTELWSGSFL